MPKVCRRRPAFASRLLPVACLLLCFLHAPTCLSALSDPTPAALLTQARALIAGGDHSGGAAGCERLLAAHPDSREAREAVLLLLTCHAARGDPAAAEAAGRRGLARYPEDAAFRTRLLAALYAFYWSQGYPRRFAVADAMRTHYRREAIARWCGESFLPVIDRRLGGPTSGEAR